jgi:hypothetical protein
METRLHRKRTGSDRRWPPCREGPALKTAATAPSLRLLGLLLLVWLVACAGSPPTPVATDTPAPPTATATPPPTATPRPTNTPTPLPPTATPTPAPLAPAAIFERVAPSIVYIETPFSSGSAILIEGNYLLTNAHVVWPYAEVRAVLPDGAEFEAVPLQGWDLMLDIAVLGPLEGAPTAALPLVDGEAFVVGSDVFLLGYPGEVDALPEPTMTRGLISRKREWDLAGITYFQTDATIARGQSGGALVSEMGDVIGLSGFAFDEGEFALVASASDLNARITELITGEHTSGQEYRFIDHSAGKQHVEGNIRHPLDSLVYLVDQTCGSKLEVEADSEVDLVLQFFDMSAGQVEDIDEGATGREFFTRSLARDRVYVVAVYAYDGADGSVRIDSSCDLIALEDEDDESLLHVGDVRQGTLNYQGDIDLFYVDVDEGEVLSFLVDSASIDSLVWITYEEAGRDGWVEDDGSGGGLFGLNADLTFQATHSGRYMVLVEDAIGNGVGAYSLSVSADRGDAPPPATIPPTPAPISSDYGEMQLYESKRYGYTMQVPSSWEDVTDTDLNCAGVCFSDGLSYLVIAEEDAVALLGAEGNAMTRAQYVELSLQNTAASLTGATLQWRQSLTTTSGLQVEVAHYRWSQAGFVFHVKLVVAFENGVGLNAMYLVNESEFATLQPVIDYTFTTLAIAE